MVRYLARRRGPFASSIAEAGAFVRTRANLAGPDLQFHFAPAVFLDNGFTPAPGHGYTFGPCLLQPASRGSVSLRTADPLAKPVLRAGYYSEAEDLRTMVEGMRLALVLAEAAPLRRHQVSRYLPEADDDAGLAAHLRTHSQSLYHPTSTAAMGPDDDDVLDPELRVRGVQGLRVVDASAFPTVPRGNTHAPVVMLAERAADLLRGASVPQQAQREERATRQQA